MSKSLHQKKNDDSESINGGSYEIQIKDDNKHNENHRFRRRGKKRYSSKDIVRLSLGFFLFITCLKYYTKSMLSHTTLNHQNQYQQGYDDIQKVRKNDATSSGLHAKEPQPLSSIRTTVSQKQEHPQQRNQNDNTMTYTVSRQAAKMDGNAGQPVSSSSLNDHLFDEDAALHFDPNSPMKDISQQTSMISRHANKPTIYADPNPDLEIPSNIDSKLANVADSSIGSSDIPLFWHILKSGGTTVKDFYAECFGFIEATEAGVFGGHDKDETLQVIQLSPDEGSPRYVNVDTTTASGIERAIHLNLIPTNLADIVFTPLLHESSEMFNPNQKAQMFGLFRHPVGKFPIFIRILLQYFIISYIILLT